MIGWLLAIAVVSGWAFNLGVWWGRASERLSADVRAALDRREERPVPSVLGPREPQDIAPPGILVLPTRTTNGHGPR